MRQTKVQKLKAEIVNIQKQIEGIQAKCKHPRESLNIKQNGSTGGWDKDTYWDEITCKKCDKYWTEDRE